MRIAVHNLLLFAITMSSFGWKETSFYAYAQNGYPQIGHNNNPGNEFLTGPAIYQPANSQNIGNSMAFPSGSHHNNAYGQFPSGSGYGGNNQLFPNNNQNGQAINQAFPNNQPLLNNQALLNNQPLPNTGSNMALPSGNNLPNTGYNQPLPNNLPNGRSNHALLNNNYPNNENYNQQVAPNKFPNNGNILGLPAGHQMNTALNDGPPPNTKNRFYAQNNQLPNYGNNVQNPHRYGNPNGAFGQHQNIGSSPHHDTRNHNKVLVPTRFRGNEKVKNSEQQLCKNWNGRCTLFQECEGMHCYENGFYQQGCQPICFDKAVPKPCRPPKNIGTCKASLLAWHFDLKSAECHKFYFSGCGGNSNRFETKEDCENLCLPDHPNIIEGTDNHPKCCTWAKEGECNSNPIWMRPNCQKSCGTFHCKPTEARRCGVRLDTENCGGPKTQRPLHPPQ